MRLTEKQLKYNFLQSRACQWKILNGSKDIDESVRVQEQAPTCPEVRLMKLSQSKVPCSSWVKPYPLLGKFSHFFFFFFHGNIPSGLFFWFVCSLASSEMYVTSTAAHKIVQQKTASVQKLEDFSIVSSAFAPKDIYLSLSFHPCLRLQPTLQTNMPPTSLPETTRPTSLSNR